MSVSATDRRSCYQEEDEAGSTAYGAVGGHNRSNHQQQPQQLTQQIQQQPHSRDDNSTKQIPKYRMTIDTSAATMANVQKNYHSSTGGSSSQLKGNGNFGSHKITAPSCSGGSDVDDRTSSPTSVADFSTDALNGFRIKREVEQNTCAPTQHARPPSRPGGASSISGASQEPVTPNGGPLRTLIQAADLNADTDDACTRDAGRAGEAEGASAGPTKENCAAVTGGTSSGCHGSGAENGSGENSTTSAELMSAQALFGGNIPGLTSFGKYEAVLSLILGFTRGVCERHLLLRTANVVYVVAFAYRLPPECRVKCWGETVDSFLQFPSASKIIAQCVILSTSLYC